MAKNLRVCVKYAGHLRNLVWISLQKEGRQRAENRSNRAEHQPGDPVVSVGFSDKSITVQDVQQSTAARTLVNPHFTLHRDLQFPQNPPCWWHLRSEGEAAMWCGLVWTTHLPDADCSPWLRFISKPVDTLPIFESVSHGKQAEIWTLPVNEICSVRLMIDFVNSTPSARDPVSKFIKWQDVTLRVQAQTLPPQQATLGYEIMG